MKHNFSRELAIFNLTQQIIEDLGLDDNFAPGMGAFVLDGKKLTAAWQRYVLRDPLHDEVIALGEFLCALGEDLKRDCGTFTLAHALYHIVED